MTDERNDRDIEALVTRALVDRGELIPTTVEEVLDVSTDDVDLPASLEGLYDGGPAPAPRTSVQRGRPIRAMVTLSALTAAAAAIWIVVAGGRNTEPISVDTTRGAPTGLSSSAQAAAPHVNVSRPKCSGDCCAGAGCSAAAGDLATCPTERTCIPCSVFDDPDTLYRLRFGDVFPDGATPGDAALQYVDLCIKVGSATAGDWSCEPARAPSSMRPHGRLLKAASRTADLARGVTIELRDGSTVYGRWWSILKPTPRGLCLGYKIQLDNDKKEPVGKLSMFLERTYYVELARRDRRADLDPVAQSFSLDDFTPQFMTSGGRQVLALGPFDRPEAERVLDQLTAKAPPSLAEGIRIDHGDGYDGL